MKELERQVRSGTATGDGPKELLSRALDSAVDVSGLRFVAADVPAGDTETIRRLADQIRDRLDADRQPGVVVLASPATGQVVATRTRKTPAAVDVGRLVRSLTEAFGGSGGGRPEFAQGGLKDGGRVQDLIALARDRTFLERVIQS